MNALSYLASGVVMAAGIMFSPACGFAQTKPAPKMVNVSDAGDRSVSPMSIKDEKGKELTPQQMQALMATGNYKILKITDKNKKPYLLVKSAPGFSPMPVSQAVVIKPGN